ncbi:MAG: helix-turn-helix transcriptional regulator [Phycisphaerales bacterium]|nr:helix-turn-helix transcriptional regulator [Phycisphaerales bacterium]
MNEHSLEHYRRIVGHRVRVVRTRRRLAIKELAERAGLSELRLAACESGRRSLTVDELERVAGVLGVPLAWFLHTCVLCGTAD